LPKISVTANHDYLFYNLPPKVSDYRQIMSILFLQVLRKMGVISISFTGQSMLMLLVKESEERFIINRV